MPARYQAQLKYQFREYTVYANRIGKGLDESTARKEYTRLRSIVNKRIARIQASDYAGQGITATFPEGLPTLKAISPKDFPYYLQQAAQAVTSTTGSLKGLERRAKNIAETLRERGLTNLKFANIAKFGLFMEMAREKGYDKIYGSDEIAYLYDNLVKFNTKDIENVFDDFEFWIENSNQLYRMKNTEPVSTKKLRKQLEP